MLCVFSSQSPFSERSLGKYSASAEIPRVSLNLSSVVFLFFLCASAVSREQIQVSSCRERSVVGELHERCLDFGVLSQPSKALYPVWTWLIQWFVKGHFWALFYVFPIFLQRFSANN